MLPMLGTGVNFAFRADPRSRKQEMVCTTLYVTRCMGLSILDAVRLLLVRIAEEGRLPFEVKLPRQPRALTVQRRYCQRVYASAQGRNSSASVAMYPPCRRKPFQSG
jgi:antitoxin component of RelBE/YafQ-DinJ toxin-antitoxin module